MEKKKLLLVAISVGIFLAIAIGAAILVFTPKNSADNVLASRSGSGITVLPPTSGFSGLYDQDYFQNETSVNTPPPASQQPASVDAVDLVRQNNGSMGLRPAPEGTSQQGSDYLVRGSGGETIVTVSRPSAAAVPDSTAAAPRSTVAPSAARSTASGSASGSVSSSGASSNSGSTSGSGSAQSSGSSSGTSAGSGSVAAVQSRPVAGIRVYDDYWVQTGAFSAITTAERVKESLSSRGIASIIENREVDGRVLFRVRVGPYTSQNEADYWLALISSIDGFEDSQVRMTQSRR